MTPRAERGWLLCLVAPVVWFAHFSALYGIASFGRAAGLGRGGFDAIAWALTLVACAAIAFVWRCAQRMAVQGDGAAQGARPVAGALALLSLVGILFQGLVLAMGPT